MRYLLFLLASSVIFIAHCGGEAEMVSKPSFPSGRGGEGGGTSNEGGASASEGGAGSGSGGEQGGKGGGGNGGSGSGGSSVDISLCDGTSQPRLRVFVAPNYIGELSGSIVRVENGYPSFLLDGMCNYWMGSWSPTDQLARDREIRTGKLDLSIASQLTKLPLGNLASLLDCKTEPGSSDISQRVIADNSSGVACTGSGAKFDQAWNIISSRATELWNKGTPLDGDIRLSIYPSSDGDNSKLYQWPLGVSLSSLALDESKSSSPGTSRLYKSDEASKLRLMRNEYLKDRSESPLSFYDGQRFSDGKSIYYIYFRDVTPYESSEGLLPFWPPTSK